ncbi:exodeoxyribonuclease V subunit gamma [Nocardia carnea]|uniref:exodeoxyribonuclease V subunit gamma n=1 Tax=Nocardia carnea TaxID=37328 RepID=UPI0024589E49|nr:exodeoxyribonuclease V subunit gamma [Nocardia carnea]
MALHIHRAERADALAGALAAVLAEPLPDPFATEVVAVPAKGVERWLAQQLSGVLGAAPGTGDGIAANIRFPAPAALVEEVLAEATGIGAHTDPWAHDRVVWTLLRVIDDAVREPWCAVLAHHLGQDAADTGSAGAEHRLGRRYATAARLATLFDGYAVQRPRLITEWADGADTDGAGRPLPEDLAWQPALWRRLRAAVGAPGPAERLHAACARLRAEPGAVALPDRLSLFGATRLPAAHLAVLTALAAHRDLHLWLTHPSPAMWRSLDRYRMTSQVPARDSGGRIARSAPANPAAGSGSAPAPGPSSAWSTTETGDPAVGAGVTGRLLDSEVTSAVELFAEASEVVNPSSALGAGPAEVRVAGAVPGAGALYSAEPARLEDVSATLVRHPLLAGLSRDIRELQLRLPPAETDIRHPAPPVPVLSQAGASGRPLGEIRRDAEGSVDNGDDRTRPATLLQALQAHIRDDDWPPVAGRYSGDGSVQIHACHGPVRQVEVLRECLLGLFAADPTLEPRDVVIMCPEVESFAPLVRAAFGQPVPAGAETPDAAAHPGHRLRVRLADRGRGATNPLLGLVALLLELARGRVTVTEVLDLAACEPVRRACGFDDDDLERMREWAVEAGARWGIGRRQRHAFGLGEFEQNTLNAALDRILLGVTADESSQDWLDRVLPLDDVDSNDIDLAGRFAEYIDRLASILRDLQGPAPAAEWSASLGRALDLLTDVAPSQEWIRTEACRELAAATAYAGDTELRLADITELLQSRLAATPTRANFRTGELTVCTMTPMRSVPHRVVVLLGMDDEVFPRGAGLDGDDIPARDPLLGERDPRSEDRQLLLDAIMAARDTLVVVHTGADPVTGAYRPPAVPVAELLDTVRAHVGPEGVPAVLTRHPLQPHDRRNFAAAAPFSFDSAAYAGAQATLRTADPAPGGPFAATLPAAETTEIGLAELIAFLEHPVRGFLWQRLGLRIPDQEEGITDRLPIEFGGLDTWSLGERMLAARLAGADPAELRAAEWRRGILPPAELGRAVLDEVERTVDTLFRAAEPDYAQPPRDIDIAVDLGGGRRLTGTVADVRGDLLVRTTYSRVAPKHRLAAWVSVLALAVTEDRAWRAAVTGRGRFPTPAWRAELTAPAADEASGILRTLVALREAGLAEPLPVPTATTAAYAEARFRRLPPEEAMVAADREFGGGDKKRDFAEHTDRHLRYVWGPAPDLSRLAATAAPAGEPVETTRFGSIARRLWAPLLRAEQQGAP